jgi:putative protein-disulfide isomerase
MANLYYIHDPMCSWCYAFDSVLQQIKSQLPATVGLIKIVAGLAPDSLEIMPSSLAETIQANWKNIEQTVPNIQFNYAFWIQNQAIRSTYPSCRAVLAAKKQGADFEDQMIAKIQWAYYQNAENPALEKTLLNCAERIGLNSELFFTDFKSALINTQLQQQIHFSRQLEVSSYPSLCIEINKQVSLLKIDYIDASIIIEQIITVLDRN